MKFRKDDKNSLLYYGIIAVVIVLLLNAFVFPRFFKATITEVDYGTFLQELTKGTVKTVEIQEYQIGFVAIKSDGTEGAYVTGRMEDPELINRLQAAKVEKFERVIPQESSPFISFILMWIFPLLIFWLIFRMIAMRMQGQMGGMGNALTFGKSSAKVYVEAQTGKSFADVAGQDEAKEALQEIVDFLHNPQKYKEVGARIPKGALLVGPPGTGKTLLAQAVAGEAKVPFFTISGSEFVEMFVGMGAARVRDLFKQAQEKAPCIIFIDEIDAIGKSRNSGVIGGNDEREQTLNQLLSEMDGFETDKGVVILAATNRPETLDKALLRPGRFDRRIPVELPDLAGREAILKVHAKKVKLGPDIDLNAIARATSGASGADLANIINEGALRAVKMGRKEVWQNDLEESVEVVIAGYQRKNAVLSVKDKLTIAYHEIGHAIVAAKQSHSAPVHKITIVPRTSGALGYTMQIDETEQVLLSKEQVLDKISTFMGGRAAEELAIGSITSGAANDIIQATKLARAMVTRFGMSEEFDMMALEMVNNPYLGGDTSLLVSAETASKIIKSCHERAAGILRDNQPKLDELAQYLVEKETISGEVFMEILNKEN
jgi:cell division protease FtsH